MVNKSEIINIYNHYSLSDEENAIYNKSKSNPNDVLKDNSIEFVYNYGSIMGVDFYLPYKPFINFYNFGNENSYNQNYVENFICNLLTSESELILYDDLSNGKTLAGLYSISNKIFKNKDSVYDLNIFTAKLEQILKDLLNSNLKYKVVIVRVKKEEDKKESQIDKIVEKITNCINQTPNSFITFIEFDSIKILNTLPCLNQYTTDILKKNLSFDISFRPNTGIGLSDNIAHSNLKDDISILIGKDENNLDFQFKLGKISENYHAIIGGQSGKGKSVLLNNIIANGIKDYAQNELQYVLIDCKGTEFLEYQDFNSKHILQIKSSSNLDDLLPIIEFLEKTRTDRELKFRENKCKSIEQFNEKNSSTKIPRIIVIIDEFQHLFTGSYKTSDFIEKVLVTNIIRTGRSFGIHLIVATQSLGDGVRKSFLDNIPLRIALGMTSSQSSSFLSFNNEKANGLEKGKAIYNSNNGDKDYNELLQINFLTENDINNILENDKD